MERIQIITSLVSAMISNESFKGQSYSDIIKRAEKIADLILLSEAIYQQDNVHFRENVV